MNLFLYLRISYAIGRPGIGSTSRLDIQGQVMISRRQKSVMKINHRSTKSTCNNTICHTPTVALGYGEIQKATCLVSTQFVWKYSSLSTDSRSVAIIILLRELCTSSEN